MKFCRTRFDSADYRRFLYLGAATIFIGLVLVMISLVFLERSGRLAAPPITGNLCLDEKLRFLRNSGVRDGVAYLVVGSSLALNNLESEALKSHLDKDSRYLNAGAFGLKISDTGDLLPEYIRTFKPRVVVLLCGTVDFYKKRSGSDIFPLDDIGRFLRRDVYWYFVGQYFDFSYFLSKARNIPILRSERSIYVSLSFDSAGAVPLEIPRAMIDETRWNDVVHPELFDELQYRSFEKIIQICALAGVQLTVVQSPLRLGSLTESNRRGVDEHWRRVEGMLLRSNQAFLKTYDSGRWDDSCFVDYSHLSKKGAIRLADFVGEFLTAVYQ